MAPQGIDSRARIRPLRAGCSFGLLHRVGTLGLVVRDETGQQRLLSSSHVLNRVPDGRRYDLYQPVSYTHLTLPTKRIV